MTILVNQKEEIILKFFSNAGLVWLLSKWKLDLELDITSFHCKDVNDLE